MKSKALKITIIVLVFINVAIFSALFIQKRPQISTVSESAIGTDFISRNMGFGIKLIPPFKLSKYAANGSDIFHAVTYDESAVMPTDDIIPGIKLEITAESNSEDMPVSEWIIKNVSANEPSLYFESVDISGKEARKSEILTNFEWTQTIYVSHNKKIYTIYVTGSRKHYDSNLKTINNMLGTLTFL